MTIEQAIQKALDTGWKPVGFEDVNIKKVITIDQQAVLLNVMWETGKYHKRDGIDSARVFLDPLFWQALGKATGWEEYYGHWFRPRKSVPQWRFEMHRFIDHLADGKTPEEFFQTLN
jgi:hypothetical protein